jgi:polyisoprenyl-teichoic acid--peptidoglycan teichoic acid transferase
VSNKPYTIYTVDAPPRRRPARIIVWVIVGLVLAALLAGGASYLWFSSRVGSANHRVSRAAVSALASHPKTTLSPVPDPPNSMNILVVGSDKRSNENGGRSDTMMVVHVDQAANFISILSIPRDLYVEVPGHGRQKINAAYAYGGPALAVTTVQNLTGIDLNQYLEIDFKTFEDLTNSLGGVYVDVDRRYYNADPTWELIKLSPGYQLLNGHDALEYVRFRHDQNMDFGRMDRQQQFLRALREQAPSWSNLSLRLPGLVNALFSNITTTLSANDILRLAYWGVKLSGDRIKQVVMTGDTPTIAGQSVVDIPMEALRNYVKAFLTPPSQGSQQKTSGSVASGPSTTTTPTAAATHIANTAQNMPDAKEWKALAAMVPYQLEGPGYIPEGFVYSDRMPQKGGTYDIVPGDPSKPGLRMIYRSQPGGAKSDLYLGITEITWLGAPIASTGEEVTTSGVTYTVVGSGQKVDHIWWKKDGVLYFISNTLAHTVSKGDLLKMAETMIVIPRPGG